MGLRFQLEYLDKLNGRCLKKIERVLRKSKVFKLSKGGLLDSIRHRNKVSFLRYQYPSRLPLEVRKRMAAITSALVKHVGFDNSCFNVEFFWEPKTDKLWFLEINTRLAESHCDLFQKIDGRSNGRNGDLAPARLHGEMVVQASVRFPLSGS